MNMVESIGGTASQKDFGAGAYRGQQGGQERGPGSGSGGQKDSLLSQVKEKAGDLGEAVSEKAKGLVEDGKSFAHQAKETAKEWAHAAGEKVDGARTAMGEGIERFGGSVRERGSSASASVGGGLEAAGTYLREHDFAGMTDSVKDVVRRHPVQAVFVGIGLGFILARAMRSN